MPEVGIKLKSVFLGRKYGRDAFWLGPEHEQHRNLYWVPGDEEHVRALTRMAGYGADPYFGPDLKPEDEEKLDREVFRGSIWEVVNALLERDWVRGIVAEKHILLHVSLELLENFDLKPRTIVPVYEALKQQGRFRKRLVFTTTDGWTWEASMRELAKASAQETKQNPPDEYDRGWFNSETGQLVQIRDFDTHLRTMRGLYHQATGEQAPHAKNGDKYWLFDWAFKHNWVRYHVLMTLRHVRGLKIEAGSRHSADIALETLGNAYQVRFAVIQVGDEFMYVTRRKDQWKAATYTQFLELFKNEPLT